MLLYAGIIGYGNNTSETVIDEKTTVKLADVDRAIVFNRRIDGSPGVLVYIFATTPPDQRRAEVTFEAADDTPLQLVRKADLAWSRDGSAPATTNEGLIRQLLENLPAHVSVHYIDLGVIRPVEMPRGFWQQDRWLVFLLPYGVLRRFSDGHQFSFLSKEALEGVSTVWRKHKNTRSLSFHSTQCSGWLITHVSEAAVNSVKEWYAGLGGAVSETEGK
jgi:hypothetical protein